MKATVNEIKAFNINPYEIRVNAMVKYCNKTYAVSCVTSRNVNDDFKYTIYTKAITYLSKVERTSKVRDRTIIEALKKHVFSEIAN